MIKPRCHIASFLTLLLVILAAMGYAQTQDDYLNSKQQYKNFNNTEWNKLKGKLQKSAAPKSKSGNLKEDYSGSGNANSSQGTPDSGTSNDGQGNLSDDAFGGYLESEDDGTSYDDKYNSENSLDENTDYNSKNAGNKNGNHTDNGSDGSDEGSSTNLGDGGYYDENYDGETYQEQKYEQEIEESKTEYKPRSSNTSRSSSSEVGLGIFKTIGIILAILLIAGMAYYLINRIKEDDSGSKVLHDLEERPPTEIPKTELELRLEQAIKNENYREAVRIYFIFIIKDLATKRWIFWERKKTNYSYLTEMRSKPQFNLFNEAVQVYEYVWYGNYEVSKNDYQILEPKFKAMLASIK